jgi:uncharacterized protein (DUF983 family)
MKLKNVILVTFSTSLFFISCGNNATEKKEKQADETVKKEAIAKVEFTCPMKCEKGKIFDAAGKCPTCKMDLVEVSHKDSNGHDHSK